MDQLIAMAVLAIEHCKIAPLAALLPVLLLNPIGEVGGLHFPVQPSHNFDDRRYGAVTSLRSLLIAERCQRTPLASLRDEEAAQRGDSTVAPVVEIVTWLNREVEAADLAYRIQKKHREQRCKWSDFAVLYRQHSHRDELVHELAERAIPFSIEGLDVLDTPEVRDVLACLSAAVSLNDAASLFRVAALPQFAISPMELRAAMRAVRRDELDLRAVLGKLPNGAAVLQSVEKMHREVEKDGARADHAANLIVRHFELPRSALVLAFLKFVAEWHKTATTETGNPGEVLQYLEY